MDNGKNENNKGETDTNKLSVDLCEETKMNVGGVGSIIDPCVICLDTVPVSERAIAFPCRHQNFNFLCLVSWLQEHPRCPLCNTEVQSVKYDWKSSQDFKLYRVLSDAREASSSVVHSRLRDPISSHGPSRAFSWRLRTSHTQPQVDPDATLLSRKSIYRLGLYSLHVGSNRLSRFRDLTPQLFVEDQDLISRAKMWIRRELRVFPFLEFTGRADNAEFLLEYIIAILKTVDIKGLQAENMLEEFLGRNNTSLFLHELKAWLRSPFTKLEDYDRQVQYDKPRERHRSFEARTRPRGHSRKITEQWQYSIHSSDRYVPYFHHSPTRSR